MKVGLIVGSLRKDSWHQKVAEVVKGLFPTDQDIEVDFIDISQVPFYNPDLDGPNELEAYKAIRAAVKDHDAFIFFQPEYNRSIAPAIKNVIDIASASSQGNLWAKKPAAVISASVGGFGGMAANLVLRQTFVFVDLIPLQQPEVYLPFVNKLFDEEGEMVENTKAFLAKVVNAFVTHAHAVLKG